MPTDVTATVVVLRGLAAGARAGNVTVTVEKVSKSVPLLKILQLLFSVTP